MQRVWNITDVTEGRGHPIRLLGMRLGPTLRDGMPLPDKSYKRFKNKLQRLVDNHVIVIGKKLPNWVLEARARKKGRPTADELKRAREPQPDFDPKDSVKSKLAEPPLKARLVEACGVLELKQYGTIKELQDRLLGYLTEEDTPNEDWEKALEALNG